MLLYIVDCRDFIELVVSNENGNHGIACVVYRQHIPHREYAIAGRRVNMLIQSVK